MLGSQLVTYQTGPEGQYVSSILLCENIYPVRQELYFGMVVDRESRKQYVARHLPVAKSVG
ncbi:ATP-grasp domain-containing protein [Escherichia coli]|uniref:ATP-grasp domain-containing protein n=1 Tax=Escherichia coli TaxID=562 RepID=UPI001FCD22F3|nr:ATP-grasp domain-containing protein [Escherichia coli]